MDWDWEVRGTDLGRRIVKWTEYLHVYYRLNTIYVHQHSDGISITSGLHVSAVKHPSSGQCKTYTYTMVPSPWEANWLSASQEIPRILWNPKVHYRTHKPPPPVSILGHPNPVHIPTSHLLILSTHLRLGLSSGLLPSGFPTKTLYVPLSSPIRATCPTHLILLNIITQCRTYEVQYKRALSGDPMESRLYCILYMFCIGLMMAVLGRNM